MSYHNKIKTLPFEFICNSKLKEWWYRAINKKVKVDCFLNKHVGAYGQGDQVQHINQNMQYFFPSYEDYLYLASMLHEFINTVAVEHMDFTYTNELSTDRKIKVSLTIRLVNGRCFIRTNIIVLSAYISTFHRALIEKEVLNEFVSMILNSVGKSVEVEGATIFAERLTFNRENIDYCEEYVKNLNVSSTNNSFKNHRFILGDTLPNSEKEYEDFVKNAKLRAVC